jgi:integrase
MGSLYLRGDIWWVKYYQNGRPIRESTEFHEDQQKQAKDFLKRRDGDVASGRPVSPKAGKVRVSELLQDLVTEYRANERRNLDHVEHITRRLDETFGYRRAHDLTAANVRAFIAKRQEEGAENGTINRDLAALKRALNLALKDEKILRKPHIPKLAEHNVRKGFFGDVEYLAMHEALSTPLNHILQFAYTYGWRKGEILGLQWPQIDFQAGTVRIEGNATKNEEARTVALTESLKVILRRLWDETRSLAERKGRPIPWVFHRNGNPVRNFRRAWKRACAKAGLPERLFHDLRRTAIRNMVRAGIPERVAMQISGHKTRSVFDRYNIVSEGDLHEATRKLEGGILSVSPAGTIPGTIEGVQAKWERLSS